MKKLFVLLLFLFLFLPLINSAAPVSVVINIDQGLNIDIPKFEVISTNESHIFAWHVFNVSDGIRLDNTSINCSFELYNQTGNHVFELDNVPFNSGEFDWEIEILPENFSQPNDYSVLINCEDTNFGGFVNLIFKASPTGSILTTGQSILYFLFLVAIAITFFTTLFWSIRLPFKNVRDASGEIISINDLKFLKIFLIAITYVLLMWIFGLLQAITGNFLFFWDIHQIFYWFYAMMLAFLYPAIVMSFLIALLLLINDKKLLKGIARFDFK